MTRIKKQLQVALLKIREVSGNIFFSFLMGTQRNCERLFGNNSAKKFFISQKKKKCCGYPLEASHWGTSNEYPQHIFMENWRKLFHNYHQILLNDSSENSKPIFLWRNKKIIDTFGGKKHLSWSYELCCPLTNLDKLIWLQRQAGCRDEWN